MQFEEYAIPSLSDLDYFRLPVYERFQKSPCHLCVTRGEWDYLRLWREQNTFVIRSRRNAGLIAGRMQNWGYRRLLLEYPNDRFAYLDDHLLITYAAKPRLAQHLADTLWRRYAEPVGNEEANFFVISEGSRGMDVERVPLRPQRPMDEHALQLHYGMDITAFEQSLIETWKNGPAGLTILRGPPGTGKTSYIRHLIGYYWPQIHFYYLPAQSNQMLSAPQMVNFWVELRRKSKGTTKIVVIEDAEELLMQRASDNQVDVSTLLNAADGLLGDLLQVRLLCTINCAVDRLDPAIVRPGRLLACREFNRLSRAHAQRLATEKKLPLPHQEDYSLAELYRPQQWSPDELGHRSVGFTGSSGAQTPPDVPKVIDRR